MQNRKGRHIGLLFLVALLLCCPILKLSACMPHQQASLADTVSLSDFCTVSPTVSSLHEAISSIDDFRKLPGIKLDAGIKYWGKISIPQTHLPQAKLLLQIGKADSIRIFVPNKQGGFSEQLTGSEIERKENAEVLSGSQVVWLDLRSTWTKEYFNVFFSVYSKGTPRINPNLYNSESFILNFSIENSRRNYVILVYLGALAIIFALAIVYFSVHKEGVYLIYAFFILLHALFIISSYRLDLFEVNGIKKYNNLIAECLGLLHWIAYLLFVQAFSQSKLYFQTIHKVLFAAIAAIGILIFINLYFGLFKYDGIYITIRDTLLLAVFLTNTVIFVLFLRSKFIYAQIVGCGGMVLTISWLVYFAMSSIGKHELFYISQVGQFAGIVIFMAGLGFKMQQTVIAKKKTESKLEGEVGKNKTQQADAQIDLEQEVALRTKELQAANEEISAQRDQIELQRQEITMQRNEMEEQISMFLEQNNEMSASIHYTRRLQRALLTSPDEISALLPQHFIFHLPKNIVSGDFYWVKQVNHYIVIAAGDCTGHGVPGAFVSLLGISALNEIVLQREFTNPGLILGEMREHIKRTLRQTGKQEEASDGIDIALCVIDLANQMLEYSGAFNPLIVIRNENIIELKGDRMPVGIHYNEKKHFSTHSLPIFQGDRLYLFSDGFPDQIGGKDDKKFKIRNFRNLLLQIHKEPMNEQHELLYQTYMGWKQDAEQVDDILVVGVEL